MQKIEEYTILVKEYINIHTVIQLTLHVMSSDDKSFLLRQTSSIRTRILPHCTFYDVLFVYLNVQAALKPSFVTENF